MAEAPRDGDTIIARRNPEDIGQRGLRTWWGTDSQGRTGWVIAIGPADCEIWYPDEFHRFGATIEREAPRRRRPEIHA